jgi:hypothetical protein
MTRRPRRNHTPVFKAKVALAAIKGENVDCRQELTRGGCGLKLGPVMP